MPEEVDGAVMNSLNDGNEVMSEFLSRVRSRRMGAASLVLATPIDGDNSIASSGERRQHGQEVFLAAHEARNHDHRPQTGCAFFGVHIDHRERATARDE
jgi:hypothetical protein